MAGLSYLHKSRVIPCDIKPQNILVDMHGVAKLADFGSAQNFYEDEDTLLSHRGTVEFLAPECFKTGKRT